MYISYIYTYTYTYIRIRIYIYIHMYLHIITYTDIYISAHKSRITQPMTPIIIRTVHHIYINIHLEVHLHLEVHNP